MSLPKHIGFIMDGNRRWAKQRLLPVNFGHKAGVQAFRRVSDECRRLEIPCITFFAFSTSNWERSEEQVRFLMSLFESYAKRERQRMVRSGVHFKVVGNRDPLPLAVRKELEATEQETQENTGMVLNLAINYSSRDEMARIAQKIACDTAAGVLSPEHITPDVLDKYSDFKTDPPCDLLIRTSGEYRLSDFLMLQGAFAELFFTPTLWPDFDPQELNEALAEYQQRERRFGGG